MLKMLLAATLAATLAGMAIQADGVTRRVFIRGMERRGTPVLQEDLWGKTWRCGDETCFAGLDPQRMVWRTGP